MPEVEGLKAVRVVGRILTFYWEEVVVLLKEIVYVTKEAVRIPPSDKMFFARANFAYWYIFEGAIHSSGFEGVPKPRLKASYAHASTVSAFCFLKNYRTQYRAVILGIILAFSLCVTWWAIMVSHVERPIEFIFGSLATISIGVTVLIPIGIDSRRVRIGRLFVAGLVVSAASATLLDVLGRPWELLAPMAFDTLNNNVLGLSLFSLALGLGLGVFVLAATAVPGVLVVRMRRYRINSREVALVLTAEVIRILNHERSGVSANNRAEVNKALAHIARCLRHRPIEGVRYVDPEARQIVSRRFRSAANAMVEYQGWISLEQNHTVANLKRAMESLAQTLLSEMYHYLPESVTVFDPPRGRSIFGPILHYAGKLAVASVPLLAVLLISLLGIDIPETLRQWITGIGVLLLLGQLIALLDPRLSWKDVGDLLNAGRKSSHDDRP